MYGSTPSWYQDSFYDITPPWGGQYGGYHTSFRSSRLPPTRTSQPRLLPLGPVLDVTSTAGPPSTVGPSASEIGTTIPAKKVDFSITCDIGETSSTSSQTDVQRKDVSTAQLKDKPIGDLEGMIIEDASQQRETHRTDERRQPHNVMSLEIRDMDIMTPDHDIYYGIYSDFQLPLPDRLRISNLFAGNTRLVSNTNSPMSILHIPSLKKMYGTADFAIDRSTGQLYKMGDLDVTPINLFGGIPDENLHEQATESMRPLLKTPQAMSTPITEISRSIPTEVKMKDSIPKERKHMSGTDITDDIPSAAPIFNLNRANVQVASSVSSLDEGEGIITADEYEKAIRRSEKINKKISTLVKNWNEESKLAKNSNEVAEIEEFYRPYMDEYNTRRKALERLMEMYDEYCPSAVPIETPQQRHKMKQQLPPSMSQTEQAPSRETIPEDILNRRDQTNQDLGMEETSLKEGTDRRPSTLTSNATLGMDTMSSILPITTRPSVFSNTCAGTTTEGIGSGRTLPQGRMSTLSSMVRPMLMTTTRTIAITREESRQDALETVRQLIGSTSHTTILPVPTTNTAAQEPHLNDNDDINTFNNEVRPRLSSSHLDSRMTDMTTPIGMATSIAPDLVWPGHPDIQGTCLFPRDDDPTTVSAGGLDPEERWKIHHPYDILGVRRPTMDTPDNLQQLAESEALVESLQTMEYLTEFPTLEERRDFRRFPPRYGDPHYHPSRLKKHDDGRSRRRPGDERTSIFGSSSDREPRRNALG